MAPLIRHLYKGRPKKPAVGRGIIPDNRSKTIRNPIMTMDYKYIEQLLEKYFECQTTLEEERILRAFFAQDTVPVRLLPYRELFSEAQKGREEDVLGEDFDSRMLAILNERQAMQPLRVKAKTVTMQQRLRPFYKAAACVAVVLALGQAAQMPYSDDDERQQNIAGTIENPDIRKDENAVAKSDSTAKDGKALIVPVAN